ncbi:MAG: SDR family NAD(P)-dependent oxidoreductase [Pseudomonadota bacterium]|jgi:short-subunit dehydrogenase|nr:short-chain dehydrogenase [Rhodobiaceae bacterium]MEC9459546.1 SDR family NAD(P)-dependent oxidoreductase [Pseudomonadota bacterium]|tara:strand:- start:24 stop:725 length:702 start_codon:yes stop_codon:yes gene_type:complete
MSNKVALITGVGPGTGSSIARRFSKGGYKIAMIARDKERLKKLEDELEGSKGYSCELRNPEYLYNTIDEIIEDFGSPNLFIHNAVRGTRGNFLEFTSEELQSNFDINVMALHRIAQKVAPEMIKNKSGAIIVTGNTSAHRGKANFGGTASTKAAQKILTESFARYLNPKGVHVAYITIDAAIDLEWTRKAWPDKPDEFFILPNDIADEVWHIAHQAKSAWTFDHWLRPFGENW